MQTTANTTPGYNSRITVRIRTNKKGRKMAHYFSRACCRWLPLKVADAEMFIATDQAWDHDEDEKKVRSSVMEYMHHNGSDAWRLDEARWQDLYFLADGFGTIDRQFALAQCWDWSHVRDSSPEAFQRIWDEICRLHNNGHLKAAS